MDNLRISVITDNLIAIIHHHILKVSKARPRPLYAEPLLLYSLKNYCCKVFQNRSKLFRPFFPLNNHDIPQTLIRIASHRDTAGHI